VSSSVWLIPGLKHQNTSSFKNDMLDKSVQTKKINAKFPDVVCRRYKEVEYPVSKKKKKKKEKKGKKMI
uniref:Uncharacterized protein n=1 Tax=Piliocolobus tephrosceles TaxID=591936 RepID=A0A8C9IHK7_9PRIM